MMKMGRLQTGENIKLIKVFNKIGFDYNVVSGCACDDGSLCDSDSVWINASGGLVVQKKVYDNNGSLIENLSSYIGGTVRFNITVSYFGASDGYVYNISVCDSLPDGLVYADNATIHSNGALFEQNIVGHNIYWNFSGLYGYLTNGSRWFIEFNASVKDTGILVNKVCVYGKECCDRLLSDCDSAVVTSKIGKYLRCDKKVYDNGKWVNMRNATVGETVKFNISISNIGYMPFYGINVVDDLPGNLKYVSGSGILLFGNHSVSFEPTLVNKTNNIWLWRNLNFVTGEYLIPGENISLLFDADVIGIGLGINWANVSACMCNHCIHLECHDYAIVNVSVNKTIDEINPTGPPPTIAIFILYN